MRCRPAHDFSRDELRPVPIPDAVDDDDQFSVAALTLPLRVECFYADSPRGRHLLWENRKRRKEVAAEKACEREAMAQAAKVQRAKAAAEAKAQAEAAKREQLVDFARSRALYLLTLK